MRNHGFEDEVMKKKKEKIKSKLIKKNPKLMHISEVDLDRRVSIMAGEET